METTTEARCLTEYRNLVQTQPELFVNPDRNGILILLEEDEIMRAQAEVAQRLVRKGLPAEWAQVGLVYEDQYLRIVRDAVRFPGGTLGTYIRTIPPLRHGTGTVILPVHGSQVILVRHFRHASRRWHLELPRGFGEPGLSDEANAARELREEIGAEGVRLFPLGGLHTDAGMDSAMVQLFFAAVDKLGECDREEGISALVAVDIANFEALIRDGEITDSYTMAAYSRAKLRGLL